MRPDRSQLTQLFGGELEDLPGLSEGSMLYRTPCWTRQSPDPEFFLSSATDVLYPEEKFQSSPSHFMIHPGRRAGGTTRLIAPDGEEVFAWSPDSKRFSYAIGSSKPPCCDLALLANPPAHRSWWSTWMISNEEVVLERSGHGKHDLIEFDLAAAAKAKCRDRRDSTWPSHVELDIFLTTLTGGNAAPFVDGRYSQVGKQLAVTVTRRLDKPSSHFDPKGFEPGVLDVAAGKLRTVEQAPLHHSRLEARLAAKDDET